MRRGGLWEEKKMATSGERNRGLGQKRKVETYRQKEIEERGLKFL